ncbi:MAG: hypothetical protein P8Z75_08040 [Gammaproteobacteria bacterium]|jgi:hypothetical protein
MNPDTSGEIALGDSDFAAFSHKSKLDKLNKKTMDTVVHEYTWSYDLLPYEVSAIKSAPDIKVKPILDVGKTLNPVKFVVCASRFLKNLTVSLLNRVRYKSLEIISSQYAIINDRCHNYATMLYYTSPANMQKQLRKCGFTT